MKPSRLIPIIFIFLASCDSIREETARQHAMADRRAKIDREIEQKGYAVVGTTPDGRPLMMKEIDVGQSIPDRVYFTDSSTMAGISRTSCGKHCLTNSVTVR